MSETDGMITADAMHDKMEDAIREPKGNGFVDCLVHFARMVTGDYMPGDVEDIIENDLDNCTPEYAQQYRMTWKLLAMRLDSILEDKS
jgi:hypothetical protein